MEARGLVDTRKERRLGGGHPHLAAALEPLEQSRAASRIEMGGDLVEEQDWWLAPTLRDQLGMGENQPEQQRLLLAGGGLGRGHPFGPVHYSKVLPMRSFGRTPGCRVAFAVGLE